MKTVFSSLGVIAVALSAVSIRAQSSDASRATFASQVAAYAAMHRDVERQTFSAAPLTDSNADPDVVRRFRDALRATRPHPREGDFFAPVAGQLRRDLRRALRERGLEARDLVAEILNDTEEGARPPSVNEPFSWAAGKAPVGRT